MIPDQPVQFHSPERMSRQNASLYPLQSTLAMSTADQRYRILNLILGPVQGMLRYEILMTWKDNIIDYRRLKIINKNRKETKKSRRNLHDDLNPCERLANSNKRRGRPRPNNEKVCLVEANPQRPIMGFTSLRAGPPYYRYEATESLGIVLSPGWSLLVWVRSISVISTEEMVILIMIITRALFWSVTGLCLSRLMTNTVRSKSVGHWVVIKCQTSPRHSSTYYCVRSILTTIWISLISLIWD